MAILSKRMLESVGRDYRRQHGLDMRLVDIVGRVNGNGADVLADIDSTSRRRNYALQQSISRGGTFLFELAPAILSWMVALEDRRRIYGGLIGGEVCTFEAGQTPELTQRYLVQHGLTDTVADAALKALPVWERSRAETAAADLKELFYQQSGWRAELLDENRLRRGQMEQINRAVEDQRGEGQPALYAFEKERMLLAMIRAGNRSEARRLLNDMLATIYMSSPKLVVLRARAVELLSCLTRAAIEDNPLLEPMIERNHAWTEKLVGAESFENLSQTLMTALDAFIDAIYLQGVNRSNAQVSQAIDYIGRQYISPISLRDVAAEVGLSSCRLAHLVKTYTGRTVMQLIYQMRISHAQKLLIQTSDSCTDIAYEVGFNDQSYFIKHFKRLTGTTPMRFRRAG